MSYLDDVEIIRVDDAESASILEKFRSVKHVLDWLHADGKKPVVDLIALDEFEHEFLAELEPTGRWIAFAMT